MSALIAALSLSLSRRNAVIQNKAIKHKCLIYCVPRNSGIAFNRYTHGPENNGNPNESLEGSKSNGL
jgi:hypothetical protein